MALTESYSQSSALYVLFMYGQSALVIKVSTLIFVLFCVGQGAIQNSGNYGGDGPSCLDVNFLRVQMYIRISDTISMQSVLATLVKFHLRYAIFARQK